FPGAARGPGGRIRTLVRQHQAEVVLFGHGFPLPLAGDALDHAVPYVVLTHGAEVWLGRTPGLALALRRSLAGARAVTAVSAATARSIRTLIPPEKPLAVLPP